MNKTTMPKKYCENCGGLLGQNDRFCEECGYPAADISSQGQERPLATAPPNGVGPHNLKGIIGGGVVVVLVVVCLFVWRQYGSQQSGGNTTNFGAQKAAQNEQPGMPAIAGNPGNSVTPDSDTSKSSAKTVVPDLTSAATYLPQADKKYYYYQYYADGDEGEVEMVAARVANGTLMSTVEFAKSNLYGDEAIFTQHYFSQNNGVYVSKDETDYIAELWLKNNLAVGQEWSVPELTVKIKEIGAVCDLGFMRIDNCLVIERHYEAVSDHVDIVYIAPGYGEVMIKTAQDGFVVKKLTKVTPMDAKTAADIIRNNSLHLDSFK